MVVEEVEHCRTLWVAEEVLEEVVAGALLLQLWGEEQVVMAGFVQRP